MRIIKNYLIYLLLVSFYLFTSTVSTIVSDIIKKEDIMSLDKKSQKGLP